MTKSQGIRRRRGSIIDWVSDEQGKHRCQCGCDGLITIRKDHFYEGVPRFLHGHSMPRPKRIGNPCACGCGNLASPGKTYVHNHFPRTLKYADWLAQHVGKHFCECGCGGVIEITSVHRRKGIPRFLHSHNMSAAAGHSQKSDPKDRLMDRTQVITNGCWLWTGYTDTHGYGIIHVTGASRPKRAHRLAYELFVGDIPAGLEIDHLCRVHNCVNPEHLEPVTRSENLRREWAARKAAR